MVVVAQLVRAPDCGSGGRRFETGLPPKQNPQRQSGVYFLVLSQACLSSETKNKTTLPQAKEGFVCAVLLYFGPASVAS